GLCGTLLDAAGLPVGMRLRCGRCGAVFDKPAVAAAAPPPPARPSMSPAPASHAPPREVAHKPPSEEGLELSLKEVIVCPSCKREYYEEDLPAPDDDGDIKCKRCKKVIKNVADDEAEEDEEDDRKKRPGARGTRAPLKGAKAPEKKKPPEKRQV